MVELLELKRKENVEKEPKTIIKYRNLQKKNSYKFQNTRINLIYSYQKLRRRELKMPRLSL